MKNWNLKKKINSLHWQYISRTIIEQDFLYFLLFCIEIKKNGKIESLELLLAICLLSWSNCHVCWTF